MTEQAQTGQTAKERYTQYFWEELAAHPDVPPSRAVISQRMGWKSSNHSGEMPQIRRELLAEAGFVPINARYYKGAHVEEHNGIRVGQKVWFYPDRKRYPDTVETGCVDSIAVSADGKRVCLNVIRERTQWISPVIRSNLVTFPDRSDPQAVERWLSSDGPGAR